ncbi:hypothetical protein [Mucilaginibacter boryungensis]|uniref:Uncharacterized protein n=1 Tax=Mucilaginibacter boryungensis TaxID=768480 RepID=A0ABR9XL01_9SPHI|nr:hypothetical protein [Mucilaginibacter boryungensis]MBE9667749.1 hypothetical protein [Mucilaginibacter boryungensis]
MNAFYQKLTQFGTLVHTSSSVKKMDMANYFTVMHPAHPIINDEESPRPAIRFEEKCPRAVKREVAILWKMVFGR